MKLGVGRTEHDQSSSQHWLVFSQVFYKTSSDDSPRHNMLLQRVAGECQCEEGFEVALWVVHRK